MPKLKIWAKFAINKKRLAFLCKYLVDVIIDPTSIMSSKMSHTSTLNFDQSQIWL